MGQSYRWAALEGTTKTFLERNVPFSTNMRVKVSLYESYILLILHYVSNVWFSNWPKCRKLEKMQRRALKWALKKKFFTDSDFNQSLIYNNLLPIRFLLVQNDLLMLKIIYNCDTALKTDDYWRVLRGPRSNHSAAIIDEISQIGRVFCFESCEICKCSHPAKRHLIFWLDMSKSVILETLVWNYRLWTLNTINILFISPVFVIN